MARRDRQHCDCATWLHKAREMPKEQFKQEVEEGTDREGKQAVRDCLLLKLYKKARSRSSSRRLKLRTFLLRDRQIPAATVWK